MSKVFFYKDKAYELNYNFGASGIKTLIPNEILVEKRLSAGARVLLGIIFTLPKGWHLRLDNLAETLGFSRQSVAKYLKEIYALNLNAFKEVEMREYEVQVRDLKSGVYEISVDSGEEMDEKAQIEEYVAQNTSGNVNNVAKVKILQTKEQKYLLYLAFNAWRLESMLDSNEIPRNVATNKKNAENVKNFNTNIKLDKSNFKIYDHSRDDKLELDSNKSHLKAKKENFKDSLLLETRTRKEEKNEKLLREEKPRQRAKNIIDFVDLSEFKTLTYDWRGIIKDWLEYKQEFHNRFLKPKQIDFQLNRIRKLIAQGVDIEAAISQSIDRGYQGLFEVKEPSFNPRGESQVRKNYQKKLHAKEVEDKEIKDELEKVYSDFVVKLWAGRIDTSNLFVNGRKVVIDSDMRASYAL